MQNSDVFHSLPTRPSRTLLLSIPVAMKCLSGFPRKGDCSHPLPMQTPLPQDPASVDAKAMKGILLSRPDLDAALKVRSKQGALLLFVGSRLHLRLLLSTSH